MFHLPLTLLQIVQLILFIVDSGCTKHMTGNPKPLWNVTIKRVYYVEGLNHNLFSVGQFCDADLEVAFRKSTCFVRDLQGNDLLIQAWLKLHQLKHGYGIRRLSHLNFDYITLLSKKEVVNGLPKLKAKRSSFKTKAVPSSNGRLNLLHMDLC
ncbi:hypothetical protein Tco_0182116, partial [Tanacetum coccineum]